MCQNIIFLTEIWLRSYVDVAYDMDEVLVEDDADLDSDESNTSDEGGSDIYWEEGEWTVTKSM